MNRSKRKTYVKNLDILFKVNKQMIDREIIMKSKREITINGI